MIGAGSAKVVKSKDNETKDKQWNFPANERPYTFYPLQDISFQINSSAERPLRQAPEPLVVMLTDSATNEQTKDNY